jgi:hypothetical protein
MIRRNPGVRCAHPEAWLDYVDDDGAVVHRAYPLHDCGYVDRRNRLIPEAEKIAARRATTASDTALSREFHRAMDELARGL